MHGNKKKERCVTQRTRSNAERTHSRDFDSQVAAPRCIVIWNEYLFSFAFHQFACSFCMLHALRIDNLCFGLEMMIFHGFFFYYNAIEWILRSAAIEVNFNLICSIKFVFRDRFFFADDSPLLSRCCKTCWVGNVCHFYTNVTVLKLLGLDIHSSDMMKLIVYAEKTKRTTCVSTQRVWSV